MSALVSADDLPFGVKGVHEECGCVMRRAETPADDPFLAIFPYVEVLVPCDRCAQAHRSYERAVEKHKNTGLTADYIAGRMGKGRVTGDVLPHISEHGYFVEVVAAIGGLK